MIRTRVELVGPKPHSLIFETEEPPHRRWVKIKGKRVKVTSLSIRAPTLYTGNDALQRNAWRAAVDAALLLDDDGFESQPEGLVTGWRPMIDATTAEDKVKILIPAPEIILVAPPSLIEDRTSRARRAALSSFGSFTPGDPDPDVITPESEIQGAVVQGNLHVYSGGEEVNDVRSVNVRTGELSISLRRVAGDKILTCSMRPSDLRVIMNHPSLGKIQIYPREAASTPSP